MIHDRIIKFCKWKLVYSATHTVRNFWLVVLDVKCTTLILSQSVDVI